MEYDVKNIELNFLKSREKSVNDIAKNVSQPYIEKFLKKGYNLEIDNYLIEDIIDKKKMKYIKEYTSYICFTLLKNNEIIEYRDGVLEEDIIIIYKMGRKIIFEDFEDIKEEIIDTLEYYLKSIEDIESGNGIVY